MDDTAVNIIEPEGALAKLDHARDDFMDSYASVPDESLGYKPEGDDYTIGYVLLHIESVIQRYMGLLDLIRDAAWGDLRAGALDQPPLDTEVDRAAALANMEQTHDTFAGKLRELSIDDFNRKSNVVYPDTTDPYPTSAADIANWLTEHYYEHIPHVQGMVEGWRNGARMRET